MKFGEIIKQLRVDKDICQEEVAKVLGRSRTQVANWEAKRHSPNYDLAIEMIDKLVNYEPKKCDACGRKL
jgi:DNA-binding XRE family transcriptional regulator